jgi:hypothetical protein
VSKVWRCIRERYSRTCYQFIFLIKLAVNPRIWNSCPRNTNLPKIVPVVAVALTGQQV